MKLLLSFSSDLSYLVHAYCIAYLVHAYHISLLLRINFVFNCSHSIYMVAISLKNEKCFDFPQIWWKGR